MRPVEDPDPAVAATPSPDEPAEEAPPVDAMALVPMELVVHVDTQGSLRFQSVRPLRSVHLRLIAALFAALAEDFAAQDRAKRLVTRPPLIVPGAPSLPRRES